MQSLLQTVVENKHLEEKEKGLNKDIFILVPPDKALWYKDPSTIEIH